MKKIVIAEDNRDLLDIMVKRFTAQSFEVVSARHGAEALELVRTTNPNVVLLDVMMPELNGYQVCRRLKEDSDLKSIPVVLLTAKDTEADEFWGYEVGADLYLTKPVDPARVVAEVVELLG